MHFQTLLIAIVAGSQLATAAVQQPDVEKHVKTKTVWVTTTAGVDRPGNWEHTVWGGHPQLPKHKSGHKAGHRKGQKTGHGTNEEPMPNYEASPGTLRHKTKKPSPHPTHSTKSTHHSSHKPKSSKHPGSGSAPPHPHPTGYIETVLHHHNVHRSNHSAPAVQWSDTLASTASKIASSCVYRHDVRTDGGGYGQNIAAGVGPGAISRIITNMFYNGEVNWFDGLYGEEHPDMTNFEHWGHFSQLVWKSTTQVGCATQYCPNGLANTGAHVPPYFTVCNYKSPGNFAGHYGDNIGKPLNRPTVYGVAKGAKGY